MEYLFFNGGRYQTDKRLLSKSKETPIARAGGSETQLQKEKPPSAKLSFEFFLSKHGKKKKLDHLSSKKLLQDTEVPQWIQRKTIADNW